MDALLQMVTSNGQALLGDFWPVVWNLAKIVGIGLKLAAKMR